MKYVPNEPNFGPSGPASINVIGKQLQIIFDEKNEVVNVLTDTLPPDVLVNKLPKNKKYFVSVSGQRDKITALRPWEGSFICEFIDFKKKPGQPPIHEFPRNRVGQGPNGPYPKDWHEFTANVRITEAPYTGLVVGIKLRYYFGMDAEEGLAVISGEGKHAQYLGRFIEVNVGDLEKVRIPFSDNILPQLEALLQKERRAFLLIMSKGWPDSFGEAPAAYNKAAKKTAVKKVAAKKK